MLLAFFAITAVSAQTTTNRNGNTIDTQSGNIQTNTNQNSQLRTNTNDTKNPNSTTNAVRNAQRRSSTTNARHTTTVNTTNPVTQPDIVTPATIQQQTREDAGESSTRPSTVNGNAQSGDHVVTPGNTGVIIPNNSGNGINTTSGTNGSASGKVNGLNDGNSNPPK